MITLQQLKNAMAKRLLRLRTDNNLTVQALSEEAGVSAGTISQLESGQNNITIDKLYPLSEYFNVPVSELLENPIMPQKIKDCKSALREIQVIYSKLENVERFLKEIMQEEDHKNMD